VTVRAHARAVMRGLDPAMTDESLCHSLSIVMRGLDPRIHDEWQRKMALRSIWRRGAASWIASEVGLARLPH
jgi:hypothetical protein